MRFFKDLRIGVKIVAIVLFATVVAAINTVVGVNSLNAMNNRLNNVVDVGAEKIKLAARTNRKMVEVSRAEKNIILSTTQQDMDTFAAYTESYRADLQARLVSLRELADAEGQRLIDEFETVWEEYLELNREVRDLTRENSTRRAFLLSFSEGRDKLDIAEAQLNALVDEIGADLEDSQALQVANRQEQGLAYQKVTLIARIKQNLLAMSRAEKNLILAENPENQTVALAVFEAEREQLNERRTRLRTLVDEERQGLLDEFAATIDEWRTISAQVRDLAVADTNRKAMDISRGDGREAFDKAAALMAQIVDKNDADLDADRLASDANFRRTVTNMIVISVGGIALGLLLGVLVSGYISMGLNHLVIATERVAAGDFTQPVQMDARDEVGILAAAFNQMTVDLQRTTVQLKGEITERKRAEEEIRKHAAEVEAANKELEAFSYSVSHDLRAPLRAVDGFSRILMEEHQPQLAPEAHRYLQLVRDNTLQMGRLIDDLLTFSRLGRKAMTKQPLAPADLVRQALEDLRPQQQGRDVEIAIGDLPRCQADPALLKQVWVNLLSNALKFTRQREAAVIEIGWIPPLSPPLVGEGPGEGCYFVKDNGAGFDMQYADKLFGVFQRLHRAEEYEGTGVGLATVQRIIHRHGGRIWAEAEVDKGATFYFTLG